MPDTYAPAPQRLAAYDVVRVVLGALLLLAALYKAVQVGSEPVPAKSIFSTRASLLVQVGLAGTVGLWLLSGLARRTGWAVALAVVSLFSLITLNDQVTGFRSCGCLEGIRASHWVVPALTLLPLLVFHPVLRRAQPVSRRWTRLAGLILSLATFLAWSGHTVLAYRPARLGQDGAIVGDQRIVLLQPRTWTGRPLPLLAHIDVAEKLRYGTWTVVLFHHDCPSCDKAIPGYLEQARTGALLRDHPRVALIELPPYAPPPYRRRLAEAPVLVGKVSSARDWFVSTPVELSLNKGGVTSVEVEKTEPDQPDVSHLAGTLHQKFAEAPRVTASPRGHDFGYVKPGSTHRVVFTIDNPADRPVKIKRIISECKCMLLVNPPTILPADRPALVQVTFIAPKKHFRYSKRILVLLDDPEGTKLAMPVEADVGWPLCFAPRKLDLGTLAPGTVTEQTLVLHNRGTTPVKPIFATSTLPGLIARVPGRTVPPGGRLEVPLQLTVPETTGRHKATVKLQTDHPKQKTVSTTVEFTVQ